MSTTSAVRKLPDKSEELLHMIAPSSGTKASIFVDAHVHVHDVFHLGEFLDAAAKNFSTQAATFEETADPNFVLCLTETENANKFESLRSLLLNSSDSARINEGHWKVSSTNEPHSLHLAHSELGSMFLIAGRQIVTAERLEVLALGCDDRWRDGQPTSDIISQLNQTDAVPVIPWGFGKWYGTRGRLVMSLLRAHRDQILFVGDNSGRPSILPQPSQFKAAAEMAIRILPGTDPLPFASEQERAGLFGFALPDPLDKAKPWQSIRRQITNQDTPISPYGDLESPWRFARNQIAMQWLMHGPSRGGNS